jgi:phage baseplate assembly protein gpV
VTDRPAFGFGALEDDRDDDKRISGVVVGKVINLVDPMALGRVQVQIPNIDSMDLSAWARVAVPMAGIAAGTYFIPNIGDEVLIAFEQGDVNVPYIVGSLWNASAPPPMPSPLAQIRMIRTPLGNQISFSEVPPTISITGPSLVNGMVLADAPGAGVLTLQVAGNTVIVSTAGIAMQSGSSVVSITSAGVTIHAPTVQIIGDGDVSVAGAMVRIN